jgi:hypothetical protein
MSPATLIRNPYNSETSMKHSSQFLVILATLAAVACGGSPSTGSDGSASGTGGGSASGGSGAPTAAVAVVPHEKLAEFLPDLPGWTREEPQGETEVADGMSRVHVGYSRDVSAIEIQLGDLAGNDALRKAGLAQENEEIRAGRRTRTTVAGLAGTQEWDETTKYGSVFVTVAGRFDVSVTGTRVESLEVVRKVVEAIDLRKLATLK